MRVKPFYCSEQPTRCAACHLHSSYLGDDKRKLKSLNRFLYFTRQWTQVTTLTCNNATNRNATQITFQLWKHLYVIALKQTYFQPKARSAVCVQLSIDSRNSAIHSAYRTLLRPSSLPEPRDPSLKIVKTSVCTTQIRFQACVRRIIYWQPRYPQSCGNYSHL